MNKYVKEINNEIQELSDHSKYVLGILNNIEKYYKEYSIKTDEYIMSMRELNTKLIEDNKNILENTKFYYKDLNNSISKQIELDFAVLNNLSKKYQKISEIITKPIKEITSNINESYLNNLQELKKIKNNILTNKNFLDDLKTSYYQESEILEDLEEKYEKEQDENYIKIINNQKESLNKSLEAYQNGVNNYNKKIVDINNEYQSFHIKILMEEENLLTFIQNISVKANKIQYNAEEEDNKLTSINNNEEDNTDNDNIPFGNYKIEDDISIFKQNFQPKFKEIEEEKFIHYEIYRLEHPIDYDTKEAKQKHVSQKPSSNNNIIINLTENDIINDNDIINNEFVYDEKENIFNETLKKFWQLYPYLFQQGLDFYPTFDNFAMFESGFDNKKSDSNSSVIKQFVAVVLSNDKINSETMKKIKNKISDINFMKLLTEKYINLKKNSFFPISNKINFLFVKRIINLFLEKLNNKQIESDFLLNQAIISICERTYYVKHNVYICALLGNNNYIKNLDNWKSLIEKKIIDKLQKKTEKLLISQDNNENSNTNKSSGLFSTFTSIFKSQDKNYENDDDEYLLEIFEFSKKIKKYYKLNKENKQILDKDLKTFFHDSLQEYIEHICNFNQELKDVISFIFDIRNKYNLSEDNFNYYNQFAYSSINTIRNLKYFNINVNYNSRKIQQKIKHIYNRQILKKTNNNFYEYPCVVKSNREREIIIINAMNYLDRKDCLSLFVLNKEISKKIRKKNYLNTLTSLSNSEKDLKLRMEIWKILLGIDKNKEEYNYEELVSKIKDKNDTIIEVEKQIDADVQRTSFIDNMEEKRTKLKTILICSNLVNDNIKYFQGLNYIASFILNLLKEEKTSFHFLMNLLKTKNFNNLFVNNLEKLRKYFVLFERLLKLYLPHIYYQFKAMKVTVNYYLSPWLITMFTNITQHCNNQFPLILLDVWDGFLIYGWKSLLSSIITLISFHEEEIMSKKGDDLYVFLINELSKSTKLKDENYTKWKNEKMKFKISNSIINGLEEEIKLGKLSHQA